MQTMENRLGESIFAGGCTVRPKAVGSLGGGLLWQVWSRAICISLLLLLVSVAASRAQENQPAGEPAAAVQPAPDDIVIDEAAPAAPAGAVGLKADDLVNLPPVAALAAAPSALPPGRGDQEVNLEVSVPSGCTVLDAVDHVFAQLPAMMPEYTWASNELDRLRAAPAAFSTPTGKTMPWDEALVELLKPQGLDFIEDGRLVRVGPIEVIEAQRANLAQERLSRNHRKIVVAFDGQALKFALENIQSQAGISMNYNYMEPADLNPVVEAPPVLVDGGQGKTPEGELGAEALQAQVAAQAASATKKVTYSTPAGIPQEWRMVLREILDPCGYDFIEVGGVVRPMTRDKIKQYRDREVNEQPVAIRVVRVYQADPKEIVERIKKMPGILKHAQAFVDISRADNSFSKRFTGSGISATTAGSGTTLGGMVSDSSNFGSMDRPRTPPCVVIGDIASNLDAIEAHIRALDIREQQVVIEAKIFEVGADIDRKLGVNWTKFGGGGALSAGAGWDSRFSRAKTRETDRGSERNWVSKQTKTRGYEAPSSGDATPADDDDGDAGATPATTITINTGAATATSAGGATVSAGSGNSEIPSTSLAYGIDASSRTVNDNDGRVDQLHKTLAHNFEGGISAILNPFEFEFYWEAVQESSDFKMVSQPVLVIGDHSEALIRVGTVTPAYTKTTSFANENNNMSESYEWQMIQDGVSLWVVPEICPDGRNIRLSVHPQFSVIGDMVVAPGGGGQFPMMGIREVDTRVVVPTGNTLLLGGLIEANSGRSQRKVPLLGDIPFLGRLFRWDSKRKAGKNLVILLTPTILDDEEPESGYEKPSEPIIKGLLKDLGKELKDPSLHEKVGGELPVEAKRRKRQQVFADETSEAQTAVEQGNAGK
jgi:type II secretory pathway component GspD/PulD (secretin)